MRERLEAALGWLRLGVDLGLALLCLAIVVGLMFGPAAPFFPVDVIGNVVAVVGKLGSEGLIGLVAVWVLASVFGRQLGE